MKQKEKKFDKSVKEITTHKIKWINPEIGVYDITKITQKKNMGQGTDGERGYSQPSKLPNHQVFLKTGKDVSTIFKGECYAPKI